MAQHAVGASQGGVAADGALDKELELTTPVGRLSRTATGIADVRLFARYTIHQRDAQGSTFRVAPFFGVEIPTGEDDHRDSLGRLPAPLQLGSGSWDPFAGIILTYQTLDYQVDAQASFKVNTRANDFEFGDEARLDASLQYRIWPGELAESGVPGYLYAVLEGSVRYQAKNEIDGVSDPDSGGRSFVIAPGIQYVTKRLIVEGIVEVPLIQDLRGDALEDDYKLRMGFRVTI